MGVDVDEDVDSGDVAAADGNGDDGGVEYARMELRARRGARERLIKWRHELQSILSELKSMSTCNQCDIKTNCRCSCPLSLR